MAAALGAVLTAAGGGLLLGHCEDERVRQPVAVQPAQVLDPSQTPTAQTPTARTPTARTPTARTPTARTPTAAVTVTRGRSPYAGTPIRLLIPRLDVDSAILPIAANDGVLVPPSDPQTLGWWDGGAVPGAAKGGALVTGHTVHTGGGSFDDLETLTSGDGITARTVSGPVHYRVTAMRVYRRASLAQHAGQVFSQGVPGRLVLVTCEDWDGSRYLSNVVVLADPVAVPQSRQPGGASASRVNPAGPR